MEKKKTNTIFTLVFLLLSVLIFYFIDNYPYHNSGVIVEYDTEISGIISYATNNRGEISLRLKRPEKKYFLMVTSNYDYKPSDLNVFVQNGDSVYKPAFCDTLYIFRSNKKYYFIINEEINYKE